MPRVFIIADESKQVIKLRSELTGRGFDCLVVPYDAQAIEQLVAQPSDIVLLNMDETLFDSGAQAEKIKQKKHTPVIALLSREKLSSLDSSIDIDDFVVKPWRTTEIIARIKRIMRQKENIESEDIIKCGDLVIDSVKYEVLLSGKPIILTFKEYQLLKFLANNKGKVFTREALLNKVWGWDYYGGDRTVDVHIRRLRSKIEDINHSFIETIRNIGYRFTEA